jgi:hypothetical protein
MTKKYTMTKKCKHCDGDLSRGDVLYCSNKCQADYQYKAYIDRWKKGQETGITGKYYTSKHIRRYLFEKYDNKCAKCGWSETNKFSGKIPLEIEHIDGDYRNCLEENFTLLCPNCHSLTKTYKGANKGKGRANRVKYRLPS